MIPLRTPFIRTIGFAISVTLGVGWLVPPVQATAAPTAQLFVINSVTVKGKELRIPVFASGVITERGWYTEKTLKGDLDKITLRFPQGSIYLTARERLEWKPNYKACLGKAAGGTTWKITGGTGAYQGASGGGTYGDSGTLLGERDTTGVCLGEKGQPPYVIVTADFVGTLRLA